MTLLEGVAMMREPLGERLATARLATRDYQIKWNRRMAMDMRSTV